jgi:hypothetical protein
MKRMTPKEFVRKCEWEGGGLFEGFSYGLDSEDIDDSDPKFVKLVERFEKHWIKADKAHDAFIAYCQEHEIGEEFDDSEDGDDEE